MPNIHIRASVFYRYAFFLPVQLVYSFLRTCFVNKRLFGYMKQAKKIFSGDGQPMLSARAAAARFACAPDYIGKLCREGKLSGVQVNGAWFVYEASLDSFESSRQEARAARSEELSFLRKQELSSSGFAPKKAAAVGFKASLASAAVGFIFVASVSIASIAPFVQQEDLSAAIGQLRSPFFGTGEQVSIPVSMRSFGDYFLNLFASDIRVQVTVRGQPEIEESAGTWITGTTSVAVAPPPDEANTETGSNRQQQIIINPVVERTVERVIVENGISPALLSSIVKELAIGSDGALQYSRGGAFSASSTALLWDNEQGALKVQGALNADSLCLQGVCITKAQLQNLLSTTTATSTP